jgi:hypothetical protein
VTQPQYNHIPVQSYVRSILPHLPPPPSALPQCICSFVLAVHIPAVCHCQHQPAFGLRASVYACTSALPSRYTCGFVCCSHPSFVPLSAPASHPAFELRASVCAWAALRVPSLPLPDTLYSAPQVVCCFTCPGALCVSRQCRCLCRHPQSSDTLTANPLASAAHNSRVWATGRQEAATTGCITACGGSNSTASGARRVFPMRMQSRGIQRTSAHCR